MKHEEELAKCYLHSLGFSDVVHEPDGNIPPDFLVNKRIAVEVRRLNQNTITESGNIEGLESLQFDLMDTIKGVLASFGSAKNGKSWLVGFRFNRPLPKIAEIKREVQAFLTAFHSGQTEDREFLIADRLTINLAPAPADWPDYFNFYGYADHDANGWHLQKLRENIEVCVQEKTAKIAKVRAKYPEWWLVLIDQIGHGCRESIEISHDWDKVILVNPLYPKSGYEL